MKRKQHVQSFLRVSFASATPYMQEKARQSNLDQFAVSCFADYFT